MGLVRIFTEQIKLEDLFLSFELTASRDGYPDEKINYTGTDVFKVGMFESGKSFGITNIEIDTALNMQPQVEITFKDLYGNLVFRGDGNNKFSKIFELPPAKFALTFKGYLGKPITYKLQLRSTSVNYVTSDGSFEIKAKFVPNIYGFFGDIPYKYLYSVDKLKKLRGVTPNKNSVLDIVKNGQLLNDKVEAATKTYQGIKDKLDALKSGSDNLYTSIKDGLFSSDGKTAWQVQPISTSDQTLISAGFKTVSFNFTNLKNNQYYQANSGYTQNYALALQRSIVTNTPTIGSNGIDVTQAGWASKVDTLSGKTSDVNKLIDENLASIDVAIQKSAGGQVDQEVIASQTIGSVMSNLVSEAAYVLGYILEGALRGYDESRKENDKLIGLYYPLTYKENTTDGAGGQTIYEQIPWENATEEMKYVQDFMKAQYEGTQEVEQYRQDQQNKDSGVQQDSELVKRITNAEIKSPNPYFAENASNICTKILQRAGVVNSRYAGPINKDDDARSSNDEITISEYENIKKRISELTGTDLETMRTFASNVTTFFNSDGAPLKTVSDTSVNSGQTYGQYFTTLFSAMKTGGMGDEMFKDNKPESLSCKYLISNNVIYYNEKDFVNKFGFKNVFINLTANQLPQTTSGDTYDFSTTAPYKNDFWDWESGDKISEEKGVNYQKLTSGTFATLDELSVILVDNNNNNDPAKQLVNKEDKVGKLFLGAEVDVSSSPIPDSDAEKMKVLKPYIVSMYQPGDMKVLYSWCTSILADTNISEEERKKRQEEEEKKQAAERGETGETGPPAYKFDPKVYDAIYHQFHHITNSWLTIAQDSLGGTNPKDLATSKNLAEELENAYLNKNNLSFTLAIQSSSVNNINLKKAIINTSQMLETDTETSVFSMLSNLSQQNNFLLQSIPGGLSDGGSMDVQNLFKPDFGSAPYEGNSLCFIWQPTPESRSLNNKSNFLYGDSAALMNGISKLDGDIPVFSFGSPDNIIVKSIKASTDDNKVTGESIAAIDDIINPQNQSKKRSFDCSVLSVMQGRSYKISLDILGNANFLPTQRFAIENIPIFTGLYWTSNVKHSITPNEMTTSIEAMKMKYDGGENFVSILPITSDNYNPNVIINEGGGNGGNGGSGGGGNIKESLVVDGLNYDFVQRVKNERFKNAADINNFVNRITNGKYSDFPTWFNKSFAHGENTTFPSLIDSTNWTNVWNKVPTSEIWSQYGSAGINYLEFITLNLIMYNETGGTYKAISEHVNDVTNKTRPGIAYTFDSIPNKKASYNKAANLTAGELFRNQKYQTNKKSLLFGNDNKVFNSSDSRWGGQAFPLDLFPSNIKQAVDPSTPTFINEADFFKYRGRGLIQNTWRGNYEDLVKYVLNYKGSESTTKHYAFLWKGSPYNGNTQDILTISSNQDWDTLFKSGLEVPVKAVALHAARSGKYQYIDLSQDRAALQKAVYKVGLRVSGGNDYAKKFSNRVYVATEQFAK